MQEREKINVKGKGLMLTYWVFGKEVPLHEYEQLPSMLGSLPQVPITPSTPSSTHTPSNHKNFADLFIELKMANNNNGQSTDPCM